MALATPPIKKLKEIKGGRVIYFLKISKSMLIKIILLRGSACHLGEKAGNKQNGPNRSGIFE